MEENNLDAARSLAQTNHEAHVAENKGLTPEVATSEIPAQPETVETTNPEQVKTEEAPEEEPAVGTPETGE